MNWPGLHSHHTIHSCHKQGDRKQEQYLSARSKSKVKAIVKNRVIEKTSKA
jgi:hypothetical protein